MCARVWQNDQMMLSLGTTWPTQQRPNVMDKPAPGMCLGMVNAFTNGLRVSLASVKCPNLTKVATRFVSTTLPEPDFKFSSVRGHSRGKITHKK